MEPTRRAILAGLGATLLPAPAALAGDAPAFVAACRTASGDYAAAVLSEAGDILLTERLDGRGHDTAVRQDPATAVVFARRPGRFALVIDLVRLARVGAFAPPPGRLFAGHGVFSADGRLLYATENDFEAERGVIGVYDATGGYRRMGEFATHGIGPHEAIMLRDGHTLAVANGGILTHPEFPRMKLNIATMAPSLALIDTRDGSLIAKAALAPQHHTLSIRHMDEAAPGVLWFGTQHEGPKTERPPLIGVFDMARGIELIAESEALTGAMDHYVGSVAASRDGASVITTSPRGGVVVEWDARRRTVRRTEALADACGAAPLHTGLALTTGEGVFIDERGTRRRSALHWDNHLAATFL